jgi:hypothetical protein
MGGPELYGGTDSGMLTFHTQNGYVVSATPPERMRITSGGNVGIGTTSPTSPGGFTKIVHISGGYASLVLTSTIPSKTWEIGVNSTSLLTFYDGVSDRMVINTSGNVGIGTTSPGKLLSVGTASGTGDIGVAGDIWIGENSHQAGGGNMFIAGSGTGDRDFNLNQYNGSSFITNFFVNGGNGNVGIGTTSPGTKLEVNGNIKLSSTAGSTSTPSNIWLGNDFSDGVTRNKLKVYLYNSGNEQYGFTIGSSGDIQYHSNAYHDFYIANSLSVRINSSGNVGIGTTSPTHLLSLSRTTQAAAYQLNINNAGGISDGNFTGIRFSQDSNAATELGNIKLHYYSTGATDLSFGTRLSPTAVYIQSGGNVGIGTTSPVEALHIAKSGGGRAILEATSGSGVKWQMNSYTDGKLYIGVYQIADYLTLTSGGNVGIGTTSPSYKLHVEGNVSGISIYASHDIAAFSDITVKKEVKRIENAIEKVKELNGYTYVRTDDETGTRRAGVIAQEVQKVLPEVVSANPDGTLNVAYSNMIALLIEGMKEQQKEIDELKKLLKK